MVLKKNGLIGTFGDKKNEISNLNKKKPILLWGAGKGGLDALFVLNKNDEHVVGFIDSNPEMEGAQISGIPVYSPTYIDQIKSDFLIIISSIYHKDISDKLKQMGYQYEQHFITITEYIVEREPGGGYSLESYVDKAISALMHMKSIKDLSILVIGSGTFPAVEIAAVLLGAKKTLSMDIVNIPKYPDITSAYGFYEAYLNQLIINEKFISLRDKNFNSTVDKIFISKNNRICLNPEYFKFYHGSAESIPSETETFDCVLSQAVMEHLSNPEGVIKEIKRVLKPKGFSFHQIDLRDHRDFNKPFEHLYLSRIKWNKEQESLDFCSGNQYRGIEFKNWFERQGFTIQSYITHYNNENSKCCEPLEINRIHDDFKHFDPTELASLGCFILAEKV